MSGDGVDNGAMAYGEDFNPSAMEGEAYDRNQNNALGGEPDAPQQPVVQVAEPQNGCWFKFKKGVRCKCLKFYLTTSITSVVSG